MGIWESDPSQLLSALPGEGRDRALQTRGQKEPLWQLGNAHFSSQFGPVGHLRPLDFDVFVLSQFPWIQIKDSKQTSSAYGGVWHPFKKHLGGDMDGGVNAFLTVWKLTPGAGFPTTFLGSTGDLGIPLGVGEAVKSPAGGEQKRYQNTFPFAEFLAPTLCPFPNPSPHPPYEEGTPVVVHGKAYPQVGMFPAYPAPSAGLGLRKEWQDRLWYDAPDLQMGKLRLRVGKWLVRHHALSVACQPRQPVHPHAQALSQVLETQVQTRMTWRPR